MTKLKSIIVLVIGILIGACLIIGAHIPWTNIEKAAVNNPSVLVAAIAALFAFLSGVLSPLVQLTVGERQSAASQTSADAALLSAKTAGLKEIAKLRVQWMDRLRSVLSEHHSILMTMSDESSGDSKINQELSRLGSELDLLLNQKDTLQKRLWQVADQVYNLHTQELRQALDKQVMEAGRAVLKSEWTKVKTEMRGSDFQIGEVVLER